MRRRVTPHSRVLDLGCGRGGIVELFWRDVRFATGLDPDSPSLTEHRAEGMPVVRGVGERLPFVDESFDVIVCLWVLEHLDAPAETLGEVLGYTVRSRSAIPLGAGSSAAAAPWPQRSHWRPPAQPAAPVARSCAKLPKATYSGLK